MSVLPQTLPLCNYETISHAFAVLCSSPVVLKLFVFADPFHCIKNRCGLLRFVNVFSIVEKLDLVSS